MTDQIFGTDGIRGRANLAPMTAEIALKVGAAAGRYFRNDGSSAHRVVIGKDTRLSGYMFENALTAGFTSTGMNVLLLGPIPTPAIGQLTRAMRADVGVMISASHNPHHDNGIKFFGPDGFKLSDEAEQTISKIMNAAPVPAKAENIGRAKRIHGGSFRYGERLKSTLPVSLSLGGLKIVIDCANGAAYNLAPELLWELGAEIFPIGTTPNGFNINDGCGSTAPKAAQKAVIENNADLGICLDGDGDRLTVIDEKAQIVNGDQILSCFARKLASEGRLAHQTVVATEMSNLAMEQTLKADGITLKRALVGDRHVVNTMRAGNFNLGGEQSGHIILLDHSTTGDGLLAGLQYLAIMVHSNKRASELGAQFIPLPQIIRNAKISPTAPVKNLLRKPKVQAVISDAQKTLGTSGRIFVRPSGTEPVIRVMLEGECKTKIEDLSTKIVNEITAQSK